MYTCKYLYIHIYIYIFFLYIYIYIFAQPYSWNLLLVWSPWDTGGRQKASPKDPEIAKRRYSKVSFRVGQTTKCGPNLVRERQFWACLHAPLQRFAWLWKDRRCLTPVFAQFAFLLQSGSPTHTEVMLSPKLWSAFLCFAYTKPHYAYGFFGLIWEGDNQTP